MADLGVGWGLKANGDASGRDPNVGRWPANLVLSHDPKCKRVGTRTAKGHKRYPNGPGGSSSQLSQKGTATTRTEAWAGHADQEVDAYECVDGCPVRLLDEQSGDRPSGIAVQRNGGGGKPFSGIAPSGYVGSPRPDSGYTDSGGASRFFATFHPDTEPFRYCPKPSTSEREFGCDDLPKRSAGEMTGGREDESAAMASPRAGAGRGDGARNFHPTIKAVALTKYFATLLLPPSREDGAPRRILTPFAGSGSEMIGALRAGWEESVGIEQDADFVRIACARLKRWSQVSPAVDEADAVTTKADADERQVALFGGAK